MPTFLQTLVPLLSSLALLVVVARSQTTSFDYYFNGVKPTDLTYQGDAHFPSNGSTYLRLTKTDASGKPETWSTGRVLYPTPIQFWQTGARATFETTIQFIITSVDSSPADGIAFFIAPVGSTIPSNSGGAQLGVFDSLNAPSPHVFAIEFDTYYNSVVDPNYRHVGIDIEYLKSSTTVEVDDSIIGQVVTARIDYEEASKRISVHVTTGSGSFDVSYVHDLSTVLNQQVQVGISATTGGSVAIHDIVSWDFTATLIHTFTEEDAKIRQYV